MGYQMVNWPMTSRNPKGAGGCTVAILATAWLLVICRCQLSQLSTVVLRHQFKLLSLFFKHQPSSRLYTCCLQGRWFVLLCLKSPTQRASTCQGRGRWRWPIQDCGVRTQLSRTATRATSSVTKASGSLEVLYSSATPRHSGTALCRHVQASRSFCPTSNYRTDKQKRQPSVYSYQFALIW